jgi:hypothetical protein
MYSCSTAVPVVLHRSAIALRTARRRLPRIALAPGAEAASTARLRARLLRKHATPPAASALHAAPDAQGRNHRTRNVAKDARRDGPHQTNAVASQRPAVCAGSDHLRLLLGGAPRGAAKTAVCQLLLLPDDVDGRTTAPRRRPQPRCNSLAHVSLQAPGCQAASSLSPSLASRSRSRSHVNVTG